MPRTALLADESPQGQRLGAQTLAGMGWRVVAVTAGEEALAALRAGDVDLVIADRRLPGIGGVELAHRMRSNPEWSAIPLLVLQGALEPAAAAESGIAGWLRKPLSAAALLPWLERFFPGEAQAPAPAPSELSPDDLLALAVREAAAER